MRRARVVAVALVLLLLEWLAVDAVVTRQVLLDARHGVDRARAAVARGDVDGALAQARATRRRTTAARWLTAGPVWALPVASDVAALVRVVDQVSRDVLPSLLRATDVVRGGRLRSADGTVDLAALQQTRTDLLATRAQLAAARQRVLAEGTGGPSVVAGGRADLVRALSRLDGDLQGALTATALAPAMLGAEGPRRYLVAFQTTAEARGTGGLIGAYAIVVADHGRIEMVRSGSDADLVDATTRAQISPDFDARWGAYGADTMWQNVNLTPHFPWAAQAIARLWHEQSGEALDGVLALDTEAAAEMVRATGPVRLEDGTRLTGDQLTDFAQRDIYQRYPLLRDRDRRQALLVSLQRQLFERLKGGGDASALLGGLLRAESEGHLKMWSAHLEEQAQLGGTLLAGEVPERPGPFAGVVINNAAANKTDSFLRRDVSWTAQPCRASVDGRREVTLRLTLHNGITAAYDAPYLAGTQGSVKPGVPLGRDTSLLSVYGSVGAELLGATVDGVETPVLTESERSHPVAAIALDVDPGQTRVLTVRWREPAAGQVQRVLLQPLPIPARTTVDVASCP